MEALRLGASSRESCSASAPCRDVTSGAMRSVGRAWHCRVAVAVRRSSVSHSTRTSFDAETTSKNLATGSANPSVNPRQQPTPDTANKHAASPPAPVGAHACSPAEGGTPPPGCRTPRHRRRPDRPAPAPEGRREVSHLWLPARAARARRRASREDNRCAWHGATVQGLLAAERAAIPDGPASERLRQRSSPSHSQPSPFARRRAAIV